MKSGAGPRHGSVAGRPTKSRNMGTIHAHMQGGALRGVTQPVSSRRRRSLTNKQVVEQIAALARQIGRLEKRLADAEKRIANPLDEMSRQLAAQNERLDRIERIAALLQADMNVVKHSAIPEAVRPMSLRRSIQKPPPIGG